MKKKVSIGIDIGGTNTVYGILNREGKFLAQGQISTKDHQEIEVFLAALNEKIRLSLRNLNNRVIVEGIGIGTSMGNINKGTIEYAANLPWKGIIPLADLFKEFTKLPVIVTNDANAAAIGEMIYGGAKGMRNFVVITLGTGLGSGFVVNGELVYGHDGFAGELGHTSIRPGESNRQCGCGRKGCLETYVSATGIKRTLFKLMGDMIDDSSLRSISFDDLTAAMISDAAKKGDKIAIRAFEHTGRMLGFKLADVVAHTNPEAIFLFGGLALAKDLIFEPTRRYMEENLLYIYKGKVKLLPSKLNSQNAAVLGASALVWNNVENGNAVKSST
ncbi:MAG: ROK family protein [Bacteroidetes bacterium]|nr:ROK family protein [Bacteroidota bacterium]